MENNLVVEMSDNIKRQQLFMAIMKLSIKYAY